MACVLLFLSINIGTAAQEHPRPIQINYSQGRQINLGQGQFDQILPIKTHSSVLDKANPTELRMVKNYHKGNALENGFLKQEGKKLIIKEVGEITCRQRNSNNQIYQQQIQSSNSFMPS